MATMFCRRILSNYGFKSSAFAGASLHCEYDSSTASRFIFFDDVSHQIRDYSGKPRFDFGRIREADDAVFLFRAMLRTRPLPSIFYFTKLLTSVVKIKQYDAALYLFDEMLHRDVPVNQYTFNIAIKCFSSLNRVGYGFAVLGSILKRGYEPNVATFNSLIHNNKIIE